VTNFRTAIAIKRKWNHQLCRCVKYDITDAHVQDSNYVLINHFRVNENT